MKRKVLGILIAILMIASVFALTACDAIIESLLGGGGGNDEIITDIHYHEWGEWELTRNADNCEDDVYSRSCSGCDEVETKKGSHDYNEKLSCDETYHWYECTGCDQLKDKAEHSWGESFSYDGTHHWYECTGCDQLKNKSNHSFGEWELSIDAGNCEDDVYTRYCSDCSKIETKNGVHIYSDELAYDGTYHWHKCSNCDQVKDKTEHGFSEWELTTDADNCEDDVYSRYCSGCGKVETKNGEHTYSEELTHDDTHHWYECSGCDQVKDKAEHDWGEKLNYDKTHHWYECSACGQVNSKNQHNISNGACSSCRYDENCTDGIVYTVSKDGTYAIVSGYEGADTDVVIAKTYNGLPVTSIGPEAFRGCSNLTSVVIPDSVTSIGYIAFADCSSLTSVVIPDSVTSIGNQAFYDCSSLASVVIPDSVTSIGDRAFSGCSSLYVVYNYSDLLIEIGSSNNGYIAYYAKILVDNGKTIYRDGGYNYTLTDDGFLFGEKGSNYTLIAYVGGEETVTLPESINGNSYDIYYMRGVVNVIIPDSVTEIGGSAFYNCKSLTSVVIGDSVTKIGGMAFDGCSSLTEIVIPDSVASIGESAFCWCTSLTSVVIGDSVTSIGYEAFYNTAYYDNISNWENGVLYIGNHLIEAENTLSGEYVIKDGTVTIASSAFRNCSSLTSVVIPDSVTYIAKEAFRGCSSLESITLPFVGSNRKTSSDTYQYPLGYIFGTNSYEGGVATTQDYYGYSTSSTMSTDYYIPASLKSVTITGGKILYGAFYNCDNITNITIGDSVTSIGYRAFYDCDSLTSVVIGDSVTSIGEYAFSWCTSLTSVVIGDSVTKIGSYAFYGCSSLTSVVIPDSVTSIGQGAFRGCSSLTSMVIPDSVTSIGQGAFRGCSSLESITLPFVGSNRKTSSDIYQYPLGYIFGTSSYEGGVATTQWYYGSSTSSTTYTVYYIPASLKSVTVTGGKILYGAFYNCGNITSVTIGDNVTSIDKDAFNGCTKITTVTIPALAAPYIPKHSLTTVVITSGGSIPDSAFKDCSSLTSVVIPDSVTSIGSSAFSGCSSLTSITIPDSVTSIGSSAFYNTAYYNNISNWENGVLYIGNRLIEAKTTLSGEYVIKDGTVTIASSAFRNCSSLTSVVIPDSVTTIGSDAFLDCSSLTSVVIPDSVTSIGEMAFYNCKSLTSMVIPDSVTSIGSSAFYNCSSLTAVYITDLTSWCNINFNYYYANPLYYAGKLYLNNELVTELVIPDSVTEIGGSAFYNCKSLTSVVIPDSVTKIGSYAFYGCSSLTSVTIPDSVTSIGERAFYNCKSLTSMVIPDSVTSIGQGAFGGCSSLESITLPFVGSNRKTSSDTYQYPLGYIFGTSSYTGGVKTTQWYYGSSTSSTTSTIYYIPASLKSVTVTGGEILYGAFYNCDGLTSVVIGDSVTYIGSFAFYDCDSLVSVTIPDSVTFIGSYAFNYCKNLTDVYYTGTEEEWAKISIGSYNSDLTDATIHFNYVPEE